MHLLTKTVVLIGGALLAAAHRGPRGGRSPPRIDLRGADVGSFVVDDAGAARLTGQVTGIPFDGTYTAVLAADDGSLPEPGVCEPATATLDVTGPKHRYLEPRRHRRGLWHLAGRDVRRDAQLRRPLRGRRRLRPEDRAAPTAGSP